MATSLSNKSPSNRLLLPTGHIRGTCDHAEVPSMCPVPGACPTPGGHALLGPSQGMVLFPFSRWRKLRQKEATVTRGAATGLRGADLPEDTSCKEQSQARGEQMAPGPCSCSESTETAHLSLSAKAPSVPGVRSMSREGQSLGWSPGTLGLVDSCQAGRSPAPRDLSTTNPTDQVKGRGLATFAGHPRPFPQAAPLTLGGWKAPW